MGLNKAIIMGRITHDLELKSTQNGVSVLSFSIAVDRNFVKQGDERQSDFIDCVAWRNQAEFITKYFGKGRMIALEGEIQTRTYQDKNGNNRKATEVMVNNVSFTGEAKQSNNVPSGQPPIPSKDVSDAFDNAQDLSADGVPF